MRAPISVTNPRTGSVDYQFVPADAASVRETAQRLRAGQKRWVEGGFGYRAQVLEKWAQEVEKAADAITQALVTDTGRYTISRSEVVSTPKKIRRWAKLGPDYAAETLQHSEEVPSVSFKPQYVPYQLAGIISPWNFPVSLSLIDALPALVAGCAVIIKPSEVTPRFVEPLRATVRAVPELAAVFDILPGDGETGAALVDVVDIICLTGSVRTGRKVAEAAGKRFIPAFLELGGKDPAVVLPGADLDRAVEAILRQGVVNSGQVCLSTERIYVHESVHDEFVDRLAAKARAVEINYPDIHRGHLGPIISPTQAAIIDEHIDDALAKGAKIITGGKVETHEGGKWCRATVMTHVGHDMKLMRDETFGPILPVMPFRTKEEAVALANDTEFGLSAAVFGPTAEAALEVAHEINAGGLSINDAGVQSLTTEAEKTSFGYSGLGGSRMGPAGIMRFFRKKALMIQEGKPRGIDAFREATPA